MREEAEERGVCLENTPAPQNVTAKSRSNHSTTGATAYARAVEFREQCPTQYGQLARIALHLHQRNGRVSITQVFELARIQGVRSDGVTIEPFRLNNTLRPAIARLLVRDYPTLEGAFELRRSLSDDAASDDGATHRGR